MGAFSLQFSTRITNPKTGVTKTEQYPNGRKGQAGSIKGVDPTAAGILRGSKAADVNLSVKQAKDLAASLVDGGRISAYEKPVYNAVIAAATGKKVQITDDTGHWRNLTVGRPAAIAFEEGVKGTHMGIGAK
jgi:hypothetical protein